MFDLTCMRDGESMRHVSGDFETGFVFRCPKCGAEVCFTVDSHHGLEDV